MVAQQRRHQKSTYDKHKPVDVNMALPPERKKDVASERRDPLFRPDNYHNGVREHQHGVTSKDKPDDVRHASRSGSKDDKAEINEFHLQPKQQPSRGRPQPLFNEGDTIVMKIKRENLVQGIGHQNGEAAAAPKKKEVSEKPKRSSTKTEDKLVLGFKQESFFKGYKHENGEEHAPQKVEDNLSMPPKPRSKRTVPIDSVRRHRSDQESRENAVPVGEGTGNGSSGCNIKVGGDEHDPASKFEERETERMMKSPLYKSLPPPPYVKPSGKAKIEKPEASSNPKARFDGEEGNIPDVDKKVSEAGQLKVNDIDDQSLKRRSSRRKHSIQSVDGDDDTRSSRRREHSRKGLQVLIDEDENDSEEKMMDKLLMHYSKKPSSYEKIKEESKSRRSHHRKDEGEEIHHPARSLSLPSEQFAGPSEPAKTFARASSFQPERSEAKHVHPKLPDYEDLAARFAELKGR